MLSTVRDIDGFSHPVSLNISKSLLAELAALERQLAALLISPEQAATEILAGMESGAFEIHFPRAFTRKFKFLRCLPYRWYFSLIHRSTGL